MLREAHMTTIHVQWIGAKALLPQSEFERLVELAQRYEEITVQRQEDDVPMLGLMRLAEQSGAFDFWQEEGEDIYSIEDGELV
jgi:hypothetical protein